jgi:hypothetical protein
MILDVKYDMLTIASINYEKGIDSMEIELLPFGGEDKKIIFSLDDFLNTLIKAKEVAKSCAKEDRLNQEE